MGLDSVELIFKIEDHFQIEIPNSAAAELGTVGQLHGYIVKALRDKGREDIAEADIYSQLRDIICHQFGVKPQKVVPSAEIVNDLGID